MYKKIALGILLATGTSTGVCYALAPVSCDHYISTYKKQACQLNIEITNYQFPNQDSVLANSLRAAAANNELVKHICVGMSGYKKYCTNSFASFPNEATGLANIVDNPKPIEIDIEQEDVSTLRGDIDHYLKTN